MSDESPNTSGAPTDQDTVKNVKSEFDRKLQAVNDQIAAQNQFMTSQFNEIMNAVKAKPALPDTSDKDLENLSYNNPAQYAKVVEQKAAVAAEAAASRITTAQNERQNMLIQLTAEYPELSDASSEMYQKVVAQSKALGTNYTPSEIKSLIRDVAADVGILPKNKRPAASTDGFSLGGTRSTGAPRGGEPRAKVDEKTLLMAQLLGRDINDPKVLKGLEEATQRDTYNRYR